MDALNILIGKCVNRLPTFQFLTAMPQLISRISHPNSKVQEVLEAIIVTVLGLYPQQSLWHLMAVAKSSHKGRVQRVSSIFSKAKSSQPGLSQKIQHAESLTDEFLKLCNFPISKNVTKLSMNKDFKNLINLVNMNIATIIPLQTSLTVALPAGNNSETNHKPFASDLPLMIGTMLFNLLINFILGFKDQVDIMPSLQRPRRITILASDGQEYIFLCKPDDDLRKDSRLMEFNSIVNKLLKKSVEARKRNLHIRTYAVIPLNEKCGLIQWVSNMNGYRNIIVKAYRERNMYVNYQEIKDMLAGQSKENTLEIFKNKIIPKHPPIFYTWFLESFPEPAKWLASRHSYTSTIAVMSMVGHIVGLGDRHGENILFDHLTGECLHVDLNCLFEKGKLFEVPERVPFRLTHNMVDAFGVTGINGAFRKSCEVSMEILRDNRELLMSILETFLHDPLCEWTSRSKSSVSSGNVQAVKILSDINKKLEGSVEGSRVLVNVQGQVDALIHEATKPENLAFMYIGWAPYL